MESSRQTPTSNQPSPQPRDERWKFLRDVLVFQLKMVVDNLRDLALIPVSLVAALIDLLSKGEREGALFYRVLHWGAESERMIDVYSAIEPPSTGEDGKMAAQFSIDAVVAQLERVVVREYEKGGTAASIKTAMDRALDQMHAGTSPVREKATQLVALTADKLRTATPGDLKDPGSEPPPIG